VHDFSPERLRRFFVEENGRVTGSRSRLARQPIRRT
jgi:hypothetical protein